MSQLEIYRPILGYEGLYEVSDLGNVRSIAGGRRRGAVLKPSNRAGYKVVSLCRDGVSCSRTIHRLVAEAFINNPANKRTVNHKDGVKTNNIVTNLEWATYAENELHAFSVLGKTPWNKDARKLLPYTCQFCGKEGKKRSWEYDRMYCNKSCAVRATNARTAKQRHNISDKKGSGDAS